MAIYTAHDEISQNFTIYGVNKVGDKLVPAPFIKGQDYTAFLFKRKDKAETKD